MNSLIKTSRKADITFSECGCIDITAGLARKLRLGHGDVINIANDTGEFYLYVQHRAPLCGRYKAQCSPSNKRGGHYRAHSRQLCKTMLSIMGQRGKVRCMTGETIDVEGEPYVTIITKKHIEND